MSKKMLINASHPEENRVAIVVDGILSELDIEIAGQQQTKGNIYKAVVVRVEPGLQAAFVDYGTDKHGFLQIGEIHPNLYPAKKSNAKEYPRINEILQRGQEILVQVVKGERGTKGAALTTLLSIPGRYMVLMPDSNTKGVSRKIEDDKERKTLKKTMAQLDLPDEMGYIVRTAGIGKEETELKRDFNYLVSLYRGILARKEKVKGPAQLYQESDIVIRSIRDYFSTEMDEVLIDDSEVYRQARDFFSLVMPDQLHLVKQHREKRPIFSRYQIEEQIETLSHNQVPLPSGGSIVIDQTEALVAIDVNSGRMAGEKGIEATAARSNIEAAAEIGRQLRLRDLGGLIVIDFIDMRDRKKVREVEQTLKEGVKDDKARITLGKISQFGLLELSRQRIRPTLSVGAYLDCPHCQGKGRIKSPEAQAVALLRQLHASVSKGQIGTIEAIIPLDVANYLHNEHRHTLSELEKRFDLKIKIHGSLDAIPEQIELELIKREKIQIENSNQTPVSHADGLEEALAAANVPEEEKVESSMVAEESPGTETTETESNTGKAAEGTTESPAGKRRRRRRRRRSGATERTQSEGQEEDSIESPTEITVSETPVVEAIPENMDTPKAKPARRSRKPAAKKVAAGASEEITETGTETVVPAAEKPKRRTRRPAAKKTIEPTNDVAVNLPEVVAEATTSVEVKPRQRTRRPTAKKTAEQVSEATSIQYEVSVDAKLPITEAATLIAEKPKRRTRRPAAKKTTEPATDAGINLPEVNTEATTPAEVKPKRRTRQPTAKKTAEQASETTSIQHDVSADANPPIAEITTPVAEKPKRRSRKPAVKKVAETTTLVSAEAATPITEKPKRPTRKPVIKKEEN